jgi:hypothetical protein
MMDYCLYKLYLFADLGLSSGCCIYLFSFERAPARASPWGSCDWKVQRPMPSFVISFVPMVNVKKSEDVGFQMKTRTVELMICICILIHSSNFASPLVRVFTANLQHSV